MQALSHSSFLQSLGYAIANSLWQAALLWLIAILLNWCFRLSAHNRYRLAISAQAATFIWFILTLRFYYLQCSKAIAASLLLQQPSVPYDAGVVSSKYPALLYITKAEALLPYLSLAYLCLLCVLAIRWLRSYRHTNHLKYAGLQKAGMDIRLFVGNMAKQLGIRQEVNIYLSALVSSPLTIGFLKPVILVPVATVNHLTTQQLEAILLHELAHIRRADYFINLLLNIVETILFFNPFTRLLSETIQKEREHCCDDWVLQFQYNASMYAEALLRIACLQASPAMAMKAEGRHKSELLWRVKRLLNHQQKRFSYSQQVIALAVTTFLLTAIAWLQPAAKPEQSAQAAGAKPQNVAQTAIPPDNRISTSLFNPLVLLPPPAKAEIQKAAQEIGKQHFDKTVNNSLDAAGNALADVAPKVVAELKTLGANKDFEKAKRDAEKALADIQWPLVQQASPFIDSAVITNAVKLALDNSNMYYNADKIKQSLAVAQQQINRLKQQHLLAFVNKNYINAIINNYIAGANMERFIKEAEKNSSRSNPKKPAPVKEKNDLQKQQDRMLHRLLEAPPAPGFPEASTLPDASGIAVGDSAGRTFGWTYTNPVYTEQVPANLADDNRPDNTIQTIELNELATKPVTHIVKISNKGHVNITIEIRQ